MARTGHITMTGVKAAVFAFLICGITQAQTPPAMVLIPAGEFQMGDTFNEGWSDELPVHAVWVDAYYMDRYEVTNQQYADALNWALGQELIYVSSGIVRGTGNNLLYCDTTSSSSRSRITWNGSTFGVVSGRANHPMARVSWYGSAAYTNWRSAMEGRTPNYNLTTWECDFNANGYRLPTEAEWEKAARGGASGLRFPHGNTINHDHANYAANGSAYTYDTSPYTTWTFHPTFVVGSMPYTSPVGYFAPNGYGLYDMAGNVWEWCNDWHGANYYSVSPYANPRGPSSGTDRVLRGGSWLVDAYRCRVATRSGVRPDLRSGSGSYGFRCAAPVLVPADLDMDGDVDSGDLAIFVECLSGPTIPYDPNNLPPGCTLEPDQDGFIAADFDRDGSVDMADFAVLQRCFSGEDIPADPTCAD